MIVFKDAYLASTGETHEHIDLGIGDGWCLQCYAIWRGRFGVCQNTVARKLSKKGATK